ncbi:MAG TPA: ZIP family metal transporter [Candidatus Binatia bacterium]|nr:ZIP family metal transporter [Candidatus Binatia bacterium]
MKCRKNWETLAFSSTAGGKKAQHCSTTSFRRSPSYWGGLFAYAASSTADVTFLLPFAAGNFIYIAAADLIPEIKHEENPKLNVVHFVSFITGIALLFGVRFVFEH